MLMRSFRNLKLQLAYETSPAQRHLSSAKPFEKPVERLRIDSSKTVQNDHRDTKSCSKKRAEQAAWAE
jgi:hypothetical protein